LAQDAHPVAPREARMTIVGAERYLFTIEEFDRMFEAGIFGEDDRIEFVDGVLVRMSAVGGRHVGTIVRLDRTVQRVSGEDYAVSVQNPIRVANRASFLPDLVVLRTAEVGNVVPTSDLALIVFEVSSSSLSYDRNTKLPAYAAAEIPEAWVCNLVDDRLERHTDPRDGAYRQVAVAGRGERIASAVLPALVLDVDAILGSPGSDDE
jgi:Uma2 family endonuclease